MIYIGIDPGLGGGIGAVDDNGRFVCCESMPVLTEGNSKSIDARAAWLLVGDINSMSSYNAKVAIEKVGAMPGQGVTSMFNFGRSYGAIIGVVSTFLIPRHDVPPQVWKRHHGLIGKDKEASRGLAVKLFPAANLSKKKDHGMAEALLIAKWLRDTDK